MAATGARVPSLDHSAGGKIFMAKSTRPENVEARCSVCREHRGDVVEGKKAREVSGQTRMKV